MAGRLHGIGYERVPVVSSTLWLLAFTNHNAHIAGEALKALKTSLGSRLSHSPAIEQPHRMCD